MSIATVTGPMSATELVSQLRTVGLTFKDGETNLTRILASAGYQACLQKNGTLVSQVLQYWSQHVRSKEVPILRNWLTVHFPLTDCKNQKITTLDGVEIVLEKGLKFSEQRVKELTPDGVENWETFLFGVAYCHLVFSWDKPKAEKKTPQPKSEEALRKLAEKLLEECDFAHIPVKKILPSAAPMDNLAAILNALTSLGERPLRDTERKFLEATLATARSLELV